MRLPEVFAALRAAFARPDRPVVAVVAGHTAKGIYKQSAGNRTWWKGVVMVDIARVPELKQVAASDTGLTAGATLSVYLSPSLRPPGDRWSLPRALALDPLLGALIRHLPGRRLSPVRREHCYRLLICPKSYSNTRY